ncbi:restriction modification system DNA specificity subunit, partial [human gut metagenome]
KGLRCIDDEIHFEIPASWQWVRIKDIFQINPKNIADDNCISAFIPMEKICATYGSEFSYDEVQWKTIKTGYTHFADGDVVFAKITPCFQNRKSVIFIGLPNGIGAGSTELKVMRPYGETINRWYLLYFLKSPYFIDEAQFKGTANQQRIITGYLENKFFPLPPKSEQDKIVEQIKQLASI